MPPMAFRLRWDVHAAVRVSGGPGSGRSVAIRRDAAEQGVDPVWIDGRGIEHASALLDRVERQRSVLGREQPVVLHGIDAPLLEDPRVLRAISDRLTGRRVVGIADAFADGVPEHVHLSAAVDASGRPSDWVCELIARHASPIEVSDATVERWAAAAEGWPLAALAAGAVLRELGASAQLAPEVWLQISLDGLPTRWPSLMSALEAAHARLTPALAHEHAALLAASPLLDGTHLEALIRQGVLRSGVSAPLRDAGWWMDASGTEERRWFCPWLRAWQRELAAHAEGKSGVTRFPERTEIAAIGRVSVADIVSGCRDRSMQVRLLRAATQWLDQEPGWAALDPDFGLIDGVLLLESHDLVGATAALERVWASATERGRPALVRASTELLAEGFARRGDRKRAHAYLKAARLADASPTSPRATVLEAALVDGAESIVAVRRLERVVEEADARLWMQSARIALDLMLDAGDRQSHAAFARRVWAAWALRDEAPPLWLVIHRVHADLHDGRTCEASRRLTAPAFEEPEGCLAASDIALWCGAPEQAAKWARRAGSLARSRGHIATMLSADLRVLAQTVGAGEAPADGVVLRMNQRAARLGRSDIRQLLTMVSVAELSAVAGGVCSGDPLVLAVHGVLRAVAHPDRAVEALGLDEDFTSRTVRAVCPNLPLPDREEAPRTLLFRQHPAGLRDSADAWTDLGRYGLYHRLVGALIDARGATPGRAVHVEELVEAMWPEERMLPESASNRFHKTLSTFRKRVSASLIERVDEGYRIPIPYAVRVVEGGQVVASCPPGQPWAHHRMAVDRLLDLERRNR